MLDALVEFDLYLGRKPLNVTYHAETDLVLYEYILLDVLEQKPHESGHLLFGTVPVLGGEGVESQVLYTQLNGILHYLADHLDTTDMTLGALLAALLGPTAVAIHDDGHMLRYPAFVQLLLICHVSLLFVVTMTRTFEYIECNVQHCKTVTVLVLDTFSLYHERILK